MDVGDASYFVREDGPAAASAVLLLHGFTGTGESWHDVAQALAQSFRVIRVDLLGHGLSDAPADVKRYQIERVADDLAALLDALGIGQVACLGYSMGGRVALAFAVRHPQRVGALLLESASPGLASAKARAARRDGDSALAQRILSDGLTAFVDQWEKLPLFATKQHVAQQRLDVERKRRLAQSATGLAGSLRGMGTGAQPSYWHALAQLACPTCLLTGGVDAKFTAIAEQMASRITNVHHAVIPAAGHTIHMEQPEVYLACVNDFLKRVGWEE